MGCMTLCQVCLSSEQPFGELFWIPAPSPRRYGARSRTGPDASRRFVATRQQADHRRCRRGCRRVAPRIGPAADPDSCDVSLTDTIGAEASLPVGTNVDNETNSLRAVPNAVFIFGADIKTAGTASLLVSLPTWRLASCATAPSEAPRRRVPCVMSACRWLVALSPARC